MTIENITADLKALCLDYSEGNLKDKNMSNREADDLIRKGMIEILGTDNPSHRIMKTHANTIFAILEEVLDQRITTGWQNDPFFMEFVEQRNLKNGDENSFYVEDNTKISVSEIAQGTLDLRRQYVDKGATFSIPMKTYGAKVYASFILMLAGRMSFEALVDKIYVAFNDHIKTEVYTQFLGSYDLLPDELKHSGNLSEEHLLRIVSNVQGLNQGYDTVIAGTSMALRGLKDTVPKDWISEEMKTQRNRMGEIRMWEGITLLTIPQAMHPNKIKPMIDNDRLFILSLNTQPIKLVRGEVIIDETEYLENYDLSKELAVIMRLGVSVIFGNLYGMYKIVR